MFALRIQAAAAAAPVVADEVGSSGGGCTDTISSRSGHLRPSTEPSRKPTIYHCLGIIHLYRASTAYESSITAKLSSFTSVQTRRPTASQSTSVSPLPPWRGKCLLVLAVAIDFSPDNFFALYSSVLEHASDILVLKDDKLKDRYSMFLQFYDQKSADSCYNCMDGCQLASGEVLHVLFLAAMDFQVSAETAITAPNDSFELPTCPICIERMGQEISGLAVVCDHSSQCSCFLMWKDSSCPVCQFCKKQQTENLVCSVCCISENICMCMICGFLGCGRYKGDHIKQHWKKSDHCYSINLETNRVFYSMDDSANCLCHPIFSSKMETAIDISNRDFAMKLRIQKEFTDAWLSEAKRGISEAISKAANDELQEMRLQIQNVNERKQKAEKKHEKLVRDTELSKQQQREIREREQENLKLKEEEIHKLKKQINDMKLRTEVQRKQDSRRRWNERFGSPLGPHH